MNNPLKPKFLSNGLEALIEQLQNGGAASIMSSWRFWLDRVTRQLETDDTLDARLTDALAEKLAEAEEALEGGRDGSSSLHGLATLYKQGRSLESRWSRRAQNLTTEQLQTVTFRDLHKALEAAAQKRFKLVEAWLDLVEQRFFSIWDNYEISVVLPEEVTTESVLGHRYLSQGIEGWLEALAEFRSTLKTGVDRQAVLARAEAAQRLLMVVQLEQQEKTCPLAVLAAA